MLSGIILFLIVEGYTLFLRPGVSEYVGQRVGDKLAVPKQVIQETTQSSETQQHLETNIGKTLPTAIAVLPQGELTLTEKRINTYLESKIENLAPLESATVHFIPDQIQVDMQAFQTKSHITLGLKAQNGRIIAVDPHLSGPLGMFISLDDLVDTLEKQINDQFATQGRSIYDVHIAQEKITVLIQ